MLESIILGTVQGIFEWLPISSQGNLVLLMVGVFKIGAEQALKYSIFLHLGTLLAVMVYFYKDIIKILNRLKNYQPRFEKKEDGLISFLIVSTIITGLIGYPLFKLIANFEFRGEVFLAMVGLALIFTGLFQKLVAKQKEYKEKRLTLKDSLLLGVLQGLSIIPGVSRSGITISTFLLRRYNPKQGLYLSFLMSIPVLFAGGIFLTISEGLPKIAPINLVGALLFSFVFGIITIKILLDLAQRIKFWGFCIVVGVLALLPLIIYLF